MQVESVAERLPTAEQLTSKPLDGLKVALVNETLGAGVDAAVVAAVEAVAAHLEGLGAAVDRVGMPAFKSGLPSYYIIASSEASSNLSRCAISRLSGAAFVCHSSCHGGI